MSVWVGGGIAVAALVFGAWRGLWRRNNEVVAERLLVQLYGAEISKLILSALLLGAVFKFASELHGGLVIGGFALATVIGAVSLAVVDAKDQAKTAIARSPGNNQ